MVPKNLNILSVMNGKDPSVHEGRVHLPIPVVFGERVIVNPKMTNTSTTQMDLEGLTSSYSEDNQNSC